MREFFHLILGDFSLAMIAALYFFATVGIVINLLHHANTRNQNSVNTPKKFSRWFLIMDNRRRLYMDILCLFVMIRFLPFFIIFDATKQEAWFIGAFLIGFGFDKAFERIQAIEGSILKVKRDPVDTDDKG
jgi:hypothetical protein